MGIARRWRWRPMVGAGASAASPSAYDSDNTCMRASHAHVPTWLSISISDKRGTCAAISKSLFLTRHGEARRLARRGTKALHILLSRWWLRISGLERRCAAQLPQLSIGALGITAAAAALRSFPRKTCKHLFGRFSLLCMFGRGREADNDRTLLLSAFEWKCVRSATANRHAPPAPKMGGGLELGVDAQHSQADRCCGLMPPVPPPPTSFPLSFFPPPFHRASVFRPVFRTFDVSIVQSPAAHSVGLERADLHEHKKHKVSSP